MKRLLLIPFVSLAFADQLVYDYQSEGNQTTQTGATQISQSVSDSRAKVTEKINRKPGTAAQQGFKFDEHSKEDLAHLEEQANNARQKAIQVNVAYEGNPVLKNKKDKMLIQNWAYILSDLGISEERTYFEAGRLNKEDFEEWANGTYNALKGQ